MTRLLPQSVVFVRAVHFNDILIQSQNCFAGVFQLLFAGADEFCITHHFLPETNKRALKLEYICIFWQIKLSAL